VNQTSITAIVKDLFEQHFFKIVDWLSIELKVPSAFIRYPTYPGLSVAVNGQRVLNFSFLCRSLTSEEGNYALINATREAACFAPYLSRRGPMITLDAEALALESNDSNVPENALLEILVLHEMVHVCMMGAIAQSHAEHEWITGSEFRYIHEAVALKTSEFGIIGLLKYATAQHVSDYLLHIQSVSNERRTGAFYNPYFEQYRKVALPDFWSELRSSQPVPGIFETVENLDLA
jgi:hypothetical protein